MARILCMHTGLTGILNASLELISQLQRLGHEVVCASPQPVGHKIEAYGFEFLPLSPVNFDPAPELPAFKGAMRKPKRLLYKLRHIRQRQAEALKNLRMDQFALQMEEFRPDLVIVDIELHEHIMTLVSERYKVLLLSQWFSTWDGKGLPPIQSDIIPGKGFSGTSMGLWFSWKKVRIKRWQTFFKKKLTSGYTDRRSVLQQYARQTGFPKEYIKKNYWPGPFSYEELPVISMTEKALEFPHKKRKGLSYVGAMVYAPRAEKEEIAPSLEAVILSKTKAGKSLVYCSVSTYSKGDISFIKKVIEAVREIEDCLLVVSLGGNIDINSFSQVPENVSLFERVPQMRVLAHTNLSINHGGIHTINECLHHKVPMLIYSGKRSDQNGCAARVEYHGLGIIGDKDLDSVKEIRAKIKQTIRSAEIVERMSQVGTEKRMLEKVLSGFSLPEAGKELTSE